MWRRRLCNNTTAVCVCCSRARSDAEWINISLCVWARGTESYDLQSGATERATTNTKYSALCLGNSMARVFWIYLFGPDQRWSAKQRTSPRATVSRSCCGEHTLRRSHGGGVIGAHLRNPHSTEIRKTHACTRAAAAHTWLGCTALPWLVAAEMAILVVIAAADVAYTAVYCCCCAAVLPGWKVSQKSRRRREACFSLRCACVCVLICCVVRRSIAVLEAHTARTGKCYINIRQDICIQLFTSNTEMHLQRWWDYFRSVRVFVCVVCDDLLLPLLYLVTYRTPLWCVGSPESMRESECTVSPRVFTCDSS